MASLKVCFLLLVSLLFVAHVLGQFGGNGPRGSAGFGGRRSGTAGRGSQGMERGDGFREGFGGGFTGGRGTSSGGGDGRFRSTLYSDDDVYGYEATYPGGEALYINYRSSEARAKRGQEFARAGPYSRGTRQGYSQQGTEQGSERRGRDANFEQPQW